MLDIKIIREHPEIMRTNLEKRKSDWPLGRVVKLDEEWRTSIADLEKLRALRNTVTAELAKKKDESKIAEMRKVNQQIKQLEEKESTAKKQLQDLLLISPNLLHDSVPYGPDETGNVEIRKTGKIPKFSFKAKDHIEIGLALGLFDFEKAAETSGARFYYLKNEAVLLDFALARYALDFLIKKKYAPVETPAMVRYKVLEGAGFFPKFREDTYKIENEDLYLVGTSEQALAAMHMNEVLREKDLPIHYAGFSPCYRTEAGAHGKDTKGIIRTHQFNKVEQFVFCSPDTSWEEHEKIQKYSEELFEGLGIPFRVVNICTGDIGIVAAKKYDIEGWFPGQNNYRELTSASNCTDYQSRRLNIKFDRKNGKRELVHTLNNTAIATGRAMAAVLENYQQEDGTVEIPKALHPYMGGIKKIEPK